MKTITVKLHAYLKDFAKSKNRMEDLEMPDDASIGWLMDFYGFKNGEIGIIVSKGAVLERDYIPAEGEVIEIFPIFAGG